MSLPFIGWRTLYIDDDGYPADRETQWLASCFVLLWWVVYVGEVSIVPEGEE